MNPNAAADRLLALALPVLGHEPALTHSAPADARRAFVLTFADEWGHRRAIDTPLTASIVNLDPADLGFAPASLAERLWNALPDPQRATSDLHRLAASSGPLLGHLNPAAIEPDTAEELASLHALWSIAHTPSLAPSLPPRDTLRHRVELAARWLLDHIQPDNATHDPWAAHVFLALAPHLPDAALYADTLLHNARVGSGLPSRRAAAILLHAARSLNHETRPSLAP
ncbi:MAG: hypothetical protein HRU70_09065 [Phycisphaeraceae bacterium]|nr:MAG: hypothetical protein HRU70_09065 [Phycisphaeraceae bacterium]